MLISAKDGGKTATNHVKDLFPKHRPVFTGDPLSGYVFSRQGSLGKPRVSLWSNSVCVCVCVCTRACVCVCTHACVCVQSSPVLNINQPPSMNLSFRWVFGCCTRSAPFSWKEWVLSDAMLVLVNHTSFLLTLERSEEEQRMFLLVLIYNMWSLQKMSLNLFILCSGSLF